MSWCQTSIRCQATSRPGPRSHRGRTNELHDLTHPENLMFYIGKPTKVHIIQGVGCCVSPPWHVKKKTDQPSFEAGAMPE